MYLRLVSILIVIFFCTKLFGQNNLTLAKATTLKNIYQDSAIWFTHAPQYNRDSTLFYFQKATKILENRQPLPYEQLLELNTNFIEYTYPSKSDKAAVIEICEKTILYYEKILHPTESQKISQFKILLSLALNTLWSNKLIDAQVLMAKALELLHDNNSLEAQAVYYTGQGIFYSRFSSDGVQNSNLYAGFRYLKKAKELYENSKLPNAPQQLYKIYDMIGWYYNVINKHDSCDYFFTKMQALMPILNNPYLESFQYIMKGNNLFRRKRYVEAREVTVKGLQILEKYKMNFTSLYPFALNVIGTIEQKDKNFEKALSYFNESRNWNKKNMPEVSEKDYWEVIYKFYEDKGDFKKAFEVYKIYADSAISDVISRSTKSLRESELQLSITKQDKELTQKRTQLIIFIGFTGLGILLLGLVYRNYRLKQKANRQLEVVNVDLANKNILLDKRNVENELLLKEIHHRVKNNLEVVSSLLALQSANIDDPDIQEAMLANQNRVHSMGILHQKLYQSEHLAFIEMKDYFKNLCENILDSYNESDRIKVNIDMKEVELDVDIALPLGLIVNELLTNSLKYAFPDGNKGEIQLSLASVNSENLCLKISDNGIGKNITLPAKGTGFGTQLVDLLTKQIEGKLDEVINNGTLITITFKKQIAA